MKSEVSAHDKKFQITRVFRAPRPAVFDWWTKAEKLQQWFGCKEAVQCEVAMDFRVGGSFTQKMVIAVEGRTCDFVVTGTYDDIVEPERIAYLAKLGDVPVRVTVEFFVEGKGTKVVVTHLDLPDQFFAGNISRGTNESFDCLESLMASQPVGHRADERGPRLWRCLRSQVAMGGVMPMGMAEGTRRVENSCRS